MKAMASQPVPHPRKPSPRRKRSWAAKAKGVLQTVSSSFPAGLEGTGGWLPLPSPRGAPSQPLLALGMGAIGFAG